MVIVSRVSGGLSHTANGTWMADGTLSHSWDVDFPLISRGFPEVGMDAHSMENHKQNSWMIIWGTPMTQETSNNW